MDNQPNAHLPNVANAVESVESRAQGDGGSQLVEPHEINEQVDNLNVTNNPGAQDQQNITNLIAPQTLCRTPAFAAPERQAHVPDVSGVRSTCAKIVLECSLSRRKKKLCAGKFRIRDGERASKEHLENQYEPGLVVQLSITWLSQASMSRRQISNTVTVLRYGGRTDGNFGQDVKLFPKKKVVKMTKFGGRDLRT
ncbi:hypothetical protein B0J17DRAFT_630070 [Rhizoctonia solani]|nr:hypothetical protein B0J17DRAFT_630070 [Rhizoctonia solani]